MKKLLAIATAFTLTAQMAVSAYAIEGNNDLPDTMTFKSGEPGIEVMNGRFMVDLSCLMELCQATINEDNTVTLVLLGEEERTVTLSCISVEQAVDADYAKGYAVFNNNIGYIPLRYMGEQLGYQVLWYSASGEAVLTKGEAAPETGFMVDTDYAYHIAVELSENAELNNSGLGGRQSGSDAEHKAADFLVEKMKEVGLTDVKKEGFSADKWQFNDASLTLLDVTGENSQAREIKPYSYATKGTAAEGLTAEIVYVGKGTKEDYKDIDVKGKIVLLDINMLSEWWISYPSMEAESRGAVAVISCMEGGFAEYDEYTLASNDFTGPDSLPNVTISNNDGNYIKELLKTGKQKANLFIDNIVEKGGTSYNVAGKIPGKSSDQMIIVGAHYDKHFYGFQDNSLGCAFTLSMAKTLIDSGYVPEKDIVFILHGAEEWGSIDSYYDWAIGSWNQVNTLHPEWAGKAVAYINSELRTWENFQDGPAVNSTPEFFSMIKDYVNTTAPMPEGFFANTVRTTGYNISPMSDDYNYSMAGIPAMVNSTSKNELGKRYAAYTLRYHTDQDLKETYNEDMFRWYVEFYGQMLKEFDEAPVLALNFADQARFVQNTIDEEALKLAGIDVESFKKTLALWEESGDNLYEKLKAYNENYNKLKSENAPRETLDALHQKGAEVNKRILKIFKEVQDLYAKLGGEGESAIVYHEHNQNNVALLNEAIESLEKGDLAYAYDEVLWGIEDEWYSYSFSKEVNEHVTAQKYGDAYKSIRFWGTDKLPEHVDLYDVINSIGEKINSEEKDVTEEIATLRTVLESQKICLKNVIAEELAFTEKTTLDIEQIMNLVEVE